MVSISWSEEGNGKGNILKEIDLKEGRGFIKLFV